MLRVVPYVVRNPGTRVSELSERFDVPEADLVQDLNLLFFTGLPPYGPGDLVDVEIEGGKVWISMADHLARPVRLTRDEGLSLALRAIALLGTPGLPEAEALRSALAKLQEGLGREALAGMTGHVEVASPPGAPEGETLALARDAVAAHQRLRIEYYSANRDEVGERTIDPEQLFTALGHWYLVAWDAGADAERMFRTDRVRRVEGTGETFTPRGLAGAGRPLYSRSEEDVPVTLRLAPEARWVSEYYEVESSTEADGVVEVTLPTKDLAWVAKLLLRLGGAAVPVAPAELVETTRRVAEETLALYR
ncbi:MAG: WYL domain-containing protein [Actinobacteria bacterium]|nr:WYL domain-containing protein [Actinomycetota bacterium]